MAKNSEFKKIGKYNIESQISEGSSSYVYLVESAGQHFALKLLKKTDSADIARFRRESSTLARLNNENLLKLFDVGEHEGIPYLVMEYLKGVTLKEEIERQKIIPEDFVIDIVIRCAKALAELHKNGLVHRDVKPANIIILDGKIAKLIDFGLLARVDQIKSETALTGTPLYCSPEQNKILKRNVDYRSDLYSLGITFFECLAGRPTFIGTVSEILQQHASTVAPDVRELNSKVRPAIAQILKKLTFKDPDDRYQSALGLLSDLQRLDEIDEALLKRQDPRLGANDRMTLARSVNFVERKKQMELIRSQYLLAQSGHSRFVIVNGPSGSGKTRICEEFLKSIGVEKNSIFMAKCQQGDSELPFVAIRGAIDGYLEELSFLAQEERESRMRALLEAGSGHEQHLLSLSKSFKKIFPDYSFTVSSSNLDGDREQFFTSVAEFFIKLGTKSSSTIFFIDDVQWIDDASQRLFQNIFENASGSKFLLLSTTRDDADSKMLLQRMEELFGSYIKEKIIVDPFSKQQLAELIADYLGGAKISETIPDVFFSRSNGNVFIATEYIRASLEQGLLAFKQGIWELDQNSLYKIAFSGEVYQLILKRIEASSNETKKFLQWAALYGSTFRPSEIATVANIDGQSLESILDACNELALIERQSTGKWKFIHDKIPESIVSALAQDKIKNMSDILAEWLFQKREKTSDEIFITARLFANGTGTVNQQSSIISQATAGDLAYENFAYREALNFYKRARKIINESGLEKSVLIQMAANMAICSTMLWDDDLATECCDLYIANAKNDQELTKALTLKIWTLNIQAEAVGAWEYFKKASAHIGKPYPLFLHWKLLVIIWTWFLTVFCELTGFRLPAKWHRQSPSNINTIGNMYRDVLLTCEIRINLLDLILVSLKLLSFGQLVGGAKERALGNASVGFVYGFFGLKGLASSYFKKAEEYCEQVADPTVTAMCEMRRLLGSFYGGLINDYRAEYMGKREYFSKYGSPAEHGRLIHLCAFSFTFKGMHKEAAELYRQLVNASEKKIARFATQTMIGALHQYWMNLFLIGEVQESQKIKKLALQTNIKARHCASTVRTLLNSEICIRRVTEQLDGETEEILNGFWRRRANKFSDPANNNVAAYMAYVRLLQFEKASTPESKLSLRLEIKSVMWRLFFMLYNPLFRSNYYFLNGKYHRLMGRWKFAEFYYSLAENLSDKSGNIRLLFDIQVERARIQHAKGLEESVKFTLGGAIKKAYENKWAYMIESLSREFGSRIFDTLELKRTSSSISSHLGSASATFMSNSDSTILSNDFLANSTSMSSDSSKVGDKGELIEQRFIDILLDMNASFLISPDPIEQAKAVLSQIIKLYAAERGFIFKKKMNGELEVLAGRGSDGIDLNVHTGYSSTVVNQAFAGAKAIVGGSELSDSSSSASALNNLRSMMATPLINNDEVLGVVYLDSSLTKGLFSSDDLELFSIVSNHIAIAFELSRMAKIQLEKINLQKELDIQSAVAAESRKVRLLVNNMQQSLFSVDSNGVVVEPVSKYSEKIFGEVISGKKIFDVLYRDLEKERMALANTALSTVFGEDQLQWDLMEENFPKKLTLRGNENRILKVQSSPLWSDKEILENILFVVEDVTSLEALEQQVLANRNKAAMLESLMDVDPVEVKEFLSSSLATIEKIGRGLDKITEADVVEVLRDLHTLKGNARLHKLEQLSREIHNSESILAEHRAAKQDLSAFALTIREQLPKIIKLIRDHSELLEKIRPSGDASGATPSLSLLALAQLEQTIFLMKDRISSDQFAQLLVACKRLKYRSVKGLALRFDSMVQEISQKLSKKVRLEVDGDALVNENQFKALQECLLHLLRNSIDHGIELPEDRLKASKPEQGTIRVSCAQNQAGIKILIVDDGRGMDERFIVAKAVERKIIDSSDVVSMSSEQKINLIFRPNFSTRDSATELSGRGIGMDVVQENIKKFGGEIKVETKLGEGSQFEISLSESA